MTTKNYLSIYANLLIGPVLLPKRFILIKLYDFCRTLDNIADQDKDLEIKKKELKKFKINFEEKNRKTL